MEMDVFVFPVSEGMKSGKYMHKVRAEMVWVKCEYKATTNE